MNHSTSNSRFRDIPAGIVVFLVALPLCLGVALASNAPLLSGLIAGIIGGIVVGVLSGSHTSVAGPAAGLTAVVAAQITATGSFQAFLVAIVLAGILQIGMGLARAGSISLFIPSSVIKGLLAAIGVIIILKQLPHLVGHDTASEADMSFIQTDGETTFSELQATIYDFQTGAMVIGLLSLALLIVWNKLKVLKKSPIPAPLVVVVLGVLARRLFEQMGDPWTIAVSHLVQVPVFESLEEARQVLAFPDFRALSKPAVWFAAVTVALVASLETLLNLEAVDKLDPKKRNSPPNRELIAQGCGNTLSGLLGGLPITSVIVRSSVNINAGARSRWSAVFHGVLLLLCVALLPTMLNEIPLSCLASILIVTGWKLASWKLFKQMYKQGWNMFLPFAVTFVAIVTTDLLIGTLIGLGSSLAFILRSNVRRPLRRVVEKHVGGEVLTVQLANQVSFLNRAALYQVLEEVPNGGHVLLDARETDYIDPDVLDLIRTFQTEEAPTRGITVSLLGFHDNYEMEDRILYADYTSRDVRDTLTPDAVLRILQDGHERFRTGRHLTRNLQRQMAATADRQTPLAAVLGCIDSRTTSELLFDLGLGDIFNVRIAGNVVSRKILASLEFACHVAGAKLILVLGHTRCGAVNAAVDLTIRKISAAEATHCDNLDMLVEEIRPSINAAMLAGAEQWDAARRQDYADSITLENVRHTISRIRSDSRCLKELEDRGAIRIIGAVYDVTDGSMTFDVEQSGKQPNG